MKYLLLILFILMIQPIYASCDDDQININTASKQELIKIVQIGEIRAEQLIKLRPFESVDDITRIKGIGDVYLSKIKEQGLACVDEEKEEEDKNKDPEEVVEESEEIVEEPEQELVKEIIKETEVIVLNRAYSRAKPLNSKDIKTENNKKDLDKSDYARYGFVIFCTLLVLLFILKENKK